MGKYFGTDGFRGDANGVLNVEHAYQIGRFLGWYYGPRQEKRAKVIIGKDTRLSGYMFENALCAGLTASGADAYLMHVTTTPSVSFVARTEDFDCGVMISASHNPYTDNGIKLLNSSGEKMDDDVTDRVEAYLEEYAAQAVPFAKGEDIGRVIDYSAGRNRYIGYLISLAAHSYKGVKVGLDCANGSTWMIAKSVFDALGASTTVIHNTPDGCNINRDCGSTHIESLQQLVREKGLDVGFAFDGDADRCLAVDDQGNVVNGDQILYVCGSFLKEKGKLENDTVVTTIMSNFGLYKAFDAAGIRYEKTAVGDRFVYENMHRNGHSLGGEQSGHIIFSKLANTGDGMITAIQLMEVMMNKKQSLRALSAPAVMYPQVLKNVRVADKEFALADPEVQARVQQITEELGDAGRILLRKSGTEPVLRVMVEAGEEALCETLVDSVIAVMQSRGLLL